MSLDKDGCLKFEGAKEQKEAEQLHKIIGKNMYPERWNKNKSLYKKLGVNAEFVIYNGSGHSSNAAVDELRKILKEEL